MAPIDGPTELSATSYNVMLALIIVFGPLFIVCYLFMIRSCVQIADDMVTDDEPHAHDCTCGDCLRDFIVRYNVDQLIAAINRSANAELSPSAPSIEQPPAYSP
jgi:hypothetical protein